MAAAAAVSRPSNLGLVQCDDGFFRYTQSGLFKKLVSDFIDEGGIREMTRYVSLLKDLSAKYDKEETTHPMRRVVGIAVLSFYRILIQTRPGKKAGEVSRDELDILPDLGRFREKYAAQLVEKVFLPILKPIVVESVSGTVCYEDAAARLRARGFELPSERVAYPCWYTTSKMADIIARRMLNSHNAHLLANRMDKWEIILTKEQAECLREIENHGGNHWTMAIERCHIVEQRDNVN